MSLAAVTGSHPRFRVLPDKHFTALKTKFRRQANRLASTVAEQLSYSEGGARYDAVLDFCLLGGYLDTERIIAELERTRDRLDGAIAALQGARNRRTRTGHRLSAAARKRISDGMTKRWAERKKKGSAT